MSLDKRTCSHVFFSTGNNESRFFKESATLLENGIVEEVYLLGVNDNNNELNPYEVVNEKIHILRHVLITRKLPRNLIVQGIKFLEWIFRVILSYRKNKSQVVVGHSVASLPVVILLKFLFGCKVVYDAHEHETETASAVGVKGKLIKWVEKNFIKHTDLVLVVSEMIYEDYVSWYQGANIEIIKNLPNLKEDKKPSSLSKYNFKEKFNLKDNEVLFIYQGLLSNGRGIGYLLDSFKTMENSGAHIVFMGNGELKGDVSSAAEKYSNIHLNDFVPVEEVLDYTSSADIGFSFGEAISKSYEYSLPNKMFEYLNAGLAVITCDDMAEQKLFLEKHDVGVSVPKEDLTSYLEKLNFDDVTKMRENIHDIKPIINWKSQEERLSNLFKRLNS